MSTVTAVPIAPVKRGYLVWLWIGIALAVIAAATLAFATPQIRLQVLAPGKGPHPTNEDVALITYVGRLPSGTVFDQSQQPTPMPVAGVVPGFSQGLKMMAKGGRYRLTIPSALGYGAKETGPIPPNSTLIFDVDLIDFLPEAYLRQMQAQRMQQGQGPQGQALPGQAPPGP